jgi:DNA-binding NarL/FixJ family response regulator
MSKPTEEQAIGVGVIEDQRETREGLAFLINHTDGFVCEHAYGSMEEALDGIGIDPPRVALLDIGLPGLDGIAGLRILQSRYPSVAPVMLTVYKDDDRIFRAMCAGACGYLLKNMPPARLMQSIREIAEGGAVMSPEVAMRVVDLFRKTPGREAGSVSLSPAGDAAAEAVHRGPPEQDCRRGTWHQHSHRQLSPAFHLREASRAYALGSGGARAASWLDLVLDLVELRGGIGQEGDSCSVVDYCKIKLAIFREIPQPRPRQDQSRRDTPAEAKTSHRLFRIGLKPCTSWRTRPQDRGCRLHSSRRWVGVACHPFCR